MSDLADPTVEESVKTEFKRPKRWNVVLLNDDYTPMEFVIDILMRNFDKSEPEALVLTLEVHTNGRGIAGTYSHEIADQKAKETEDEAAVRGYPLRCTIEEAPTDE